ncbi:hypothetical protein KXS07_17765 [Inquilinus limosus]|uniref:hypothetical protein n=1 Tax=Inquilinus limosus TaxID=171674 RepID=UPI0003F821C2|nr:hypothetical protein [Inquilinus limosus]
MLRLVLTAGLLAVLAVPALAAESCDVNAESAAVVAAWGAKVRDGSLPEDKLAEISNKIQSLPSISAQDPNKACAVLAEIKRDLGL